jgi:hypothetical protein
MAYKINQMKIRSVTEYPKGKGVYSILIIDKDKNVIGEKIVEASSGEYIEQHPQEYLGKGRYIGGIRKTKIRDYQKWKMQPQSKRFPN